MTNTNASGYHVIWVSISLTFDENSNTHFASSVYFFGIRLSPYAVGVHTGIDAYPQCNIPNAGNTFFAGYKAITDESLQVRLILFVIIPSCRSCCLISLTFL
jgi:hypothetical protein